MNIACKVYGWLLIAYPPEFRRRFEDEMLQVFRDSYRAEAKSRTLPSFSLRVLMDLALTAAKERSSGKEGVVMDRRRDVVALLGCIAIIVVAFLLLTYGRRNEVSSILTFGYVLDALVTTGIIANLIIFVLNRATRLDPLRTALWTLAVVHAVPMLFIVLVAGRNDPAFKLANILVGYVVSFVIWAALHFAWRHRPEVYS